jgi:hypothetical protein
MTEFDWHEESAPAGLPVRQVHGWLADESGRFLLQDRVHEQKFLLPGGSATAQAKAGLPPCCGNARKRARSGSSGTAWRTWTVMAFVPAACRSVPGSLAS